MSIKLIDAVFKHGPLHLSLRMMLLALAEHSDDHGLAWPSVTLLCAETTMCRRNVMYCLGDLEREGWITTAHRKGKLSYYQINLPKLQLVQDMHQCKTCTSASDAGVLVQQVHSTSANENTPIRKEPSRTVIEPSVVTVVQLSKPKANGDAEEAQMVATSVMVELRLSGIKLRLAIVEQAGMELTGGRSPDEVHNDMTSAWSAYLKKTASNVGFRCSAEKFFAEKWRQYLDAPASGQKWLDAKTGKPI